MAQSKDLETALAHLLISGREDCMCLSLGTAGSEK